jgi:hypothetical protein
LNVSLLRDNGRETEAAAQARVILLFFAVDKVCHGPTRAFNRSGRFV